MERLDRIRLADLSLFECIDSGEVSLYYVHRLTAKFLLAKMDTKSKQKYHLRSAQYFESFINEENVIVISIDNHLGILLTDFGKYDEALDKYRQSLEIAEKIGYITGIGASILEMGQVFLINNEITWRRQWYRGNESLL